MQPKPKNTTLVLRTQDDVQRMADTLDSLIRSPRRQGTTIGVARKWLCLAYRESAPLAKVKIHQTLVPIGYVMNPISFAHNLASNANLLNYPSIRARVKGDFVTVIGSTKQRGNVLRSIVDELLQTGKCVLPLIALPKAYTNQLFRLTRYLKLQTRRRVFAKVVKNNLQITCQTKSA